MTFGKERTVVLVAILIISSMIAPVVMLGDDSDAASQEGNFLLDRGDGVVKWAEGGTGSFKSVITTGLGNIGADFSLDGSIIVDGVGSKVIGAPSSGGSMSVAGTTGTTIEVAWNVYLWNGTSWEYVSDLNGDSGSAPVALGYYPEGIVPTVTPDHPSAWTMSRGDASNSGSAIAEIGSSGEYNTEWKATGASYANMLYAGGCVFQKFGVFGVDKLARLVCMDAQTGEDVWTFSFPSGANYESSTPLIVGDSIYIATMTGYIYKMPWRTGPGTDNINVTSFNGSEMASVKPAPSLPLTDLVGKSYNAAFSSMVYGNGAIYVTHSNGMVYCFDIDLNLIWSNLLTGSTYLVSPTLVDDILYVGALDGSLNVFDSKSGNLLASETVYQVKVKEDTYGNVGQVAVIRDNGKHILFFTVSDGRGMDQKYSGLAAYSFDISSNVLTKLYLDDTLGITGRYVLPVETDSFSGAYVLISNGVDTSLYRLGADLNLECITEGLAEIHSAMVLVNGQHIFAHSYSSSDPIYMLSVNGGIEGVAKVPPGVRNFNMVAPLVIDGLFLSGTDAGIFALSGGFTGYSGPDASKGLPVIGILAIIVFAIMVVLAAIYAVIRFAKDEERPFAYLKERFVHYLYGDDISHNTRSRHRLKFIIIIGTILSFSAFTLCLCVGATSVLNPVEAYQALFSAISKGGVGLDSTEMTVFVTRLPRTIAAFAVGIGLSVAGCIYQAIIRNPLVDPYIMGVSSGAGVAAIAVIAFDFTFFGLFSPHSIFLTAITAAIGGLLAFACTMVLAEKAGGSAINYVLSGVVVGLAFSAVQTLMLTMSGNKLSNALSWLYGSFAEITWSQIGIVLFLSLFLSAVPLLWAKELNLVLLGEDQARQMGLDVRKFNRLLLILASVLTSVCVAFCGVIGFVGLVIPHLCRMILGSDHRMVLPASICFGGAMLMLADLLARTGYYGMELPVGAITTVIGIPVFAYLLIKRGRMYDG